MNRLDGLAGFLARRARLVVAAWFLLVVVLAGQGRGLERDLFMHAFFVEGSQSKRTHDIAIREFGSELGLAVMLRGPEDAVGGQGRLLAERLNRDPRFLVLSPWSLGADSGLRPRPGVVGLVVRAEGFKEEEATALLPPIERQIDATVDAPVRTSLAGLPVFLDSIRESSKQAGASGELIAIPVLLFVLLFVFRSVLAALVPILIGAAVVGASRGVLSFLAVPVEMDLFALGVVSMLGLALGVDYSLLTISRYREERRDSGDAAALAVTVGGTARAILPAACGLLIAMAAAYLVYPTVTTRSIAIAVSVVTVFSALSALCVVPSLLVLLGNNLDRWSLRERRASQVAPLRWPRRLAAHPGAVIAIVVVLLSFSGLAFGLDSGLGNIAFLPREDPGRVQQEAVEDELGPGWVAPMEVVVNGRSRPITSSQRLRALADFERRVTHDPGIATVAGFALVERQVSPLEGVEGSLVEQERGLDRLGTGVSRLHEGAVATSDGMLAAAEGARAIHFGLGATHEGAGLLADGLGSAGTGSTQLSDGLRRASDGGGRLAQGTARASKGAGRLAEGLAQAKDGTGEMSESTPLMENAMRSGEERLVELHEPVRASSEQLGAAWAALQRMSVGRDDPEYAAAVRAVAEASRSLTGNDIQTGERVDPAYRGVEDGIERADGQFEVGLYLVGKLSGGGREAADGIRKLAKGSAELDRALRRLRRGSRRLSDGIDDLSRGGETLSPAIVRIGDGAEALAGGLEQLEGGAGELATGLAGGGQESKLLSGGLGRIDTTLERQQAAGGGLGVDELRTTSPNLFRAGYFNLAALAGSSGEQREQLDALLNLDSGGRVGRILVIPRDAPGTPRVEETRGRLMDDAAALAEKSGAEVVVGGAGPGLSDANEELRGRAIWLRLALSLVSFLVLVPVVRSLTIPILAALLNLVTVSACFGVLSLLFDGSLLGGPGYVDAMVLHASMIVMFGLAIDYEVFVFSRMREEYVRTGSPSIALKDGLDRTAPVITGAAVIMIAVFLAFSISELVTLRNFGVAQSLGVFIDAFLIRLVVIPAVMARLGEWSWWMPAWLDRLLPGGTTVSRPAPS